MTSGKNILTSSLFLNILKSTNKVKAEIFIFYVTFSFYILLWVFNPGNKIILASYFLLFSVYYWRFRNFRVSVIFTFLASTIIFSGKRYLIELVPPGLFPEEIFPNGYVLFFVITPKLILSFLLTLVLLRDFALGKGKKIEISKMDLLVFVYFIWMVIADILGSIRPEVSLLFSISELNILILYASLRLYRKEVQKFIPAIVSLFAALVFFQSLISFQQFISSSPVYKNIETQVDLEFFGNVADEPQFRFRPIGTFEHANVLGMWLSFWLSVLLAYIVKRPNYILFVPILLGLVTLVLTLSRSSWLGFGLSILFLIFILEKIKKISFPKILTKHLTLILFLFFFLIIFFIFPRLEKSLYTFTEGGGELRYLQTRDSIALLLQNPIFGFGSGMDILASLIVNPGSVFSVVALSIHNWYIFTAILHGIPSLIIFFTLILIWLKEHLGSVLRSGMVKETNFISLGLLGGLFSLLVVGIFQPFNGSELIFFTFAILGGNNALVYEKD